MGNSLEQLSSDGAGESAPGEAGVVVGAVAMLTSLELAALDPEANGLLVRANVAGDVGNGQELLKILVHTATETPGGGGLARGRFEQLALFAQGVGAVRLCRDMGPETRFAEAATSHDHRHPGTRAALAALALRAIRSASGGRDVRLDAWD